MADLSQVLPAFPLERYAALLPALEAHQVSTAELLALDAADVGRRTRLPLLDVRRLCEAVLRALHADLGVLDAGSGGGGGDEAKRGRKREEMENEREKEEEKEEEEEEEEGEKKADRQWQTISTLDPRLDRLLGGGVPTGRVTEVVGESGSGKTQLLLTLLLAVQLPPPRGLGRPALYVSTEATLSTRRLEQLLMRHPAFAAQGEDKDKDKDKDKGTDGDADEDEDASESNAVRKKRRMMMMKNKSRNSAAAAAERLASFLQGIGSAITPDLESQDHILSYHVPVEVARQNVGLLVLDSVAANYRAEFEHRKAGAGGGSGPSSSSTTTTTEKSTSLGARSVELVRLGMQLRELARRHNLAVVVANQVADRFSEGAKIPASLLRPPPPPPLPSQLPSSSLSVPGAAAAAANSSPSAMRGRAAQTPLPVDEPSSSLADLLPRSSLPDVFPSPAPQVWTTGGREDRGEVEADFPALHLDHQQRWFTGWGDDPEEAAREGGGDTSLKTPSLGLVWSTQIAARVALLKKSVWGGAAAAVVGKRKFREGEEEEEGGGGGEDGNLMMMPTVRSWRRYMKVVFAPHVAASGPGLDGAVEFEITMGGMRAVQQDATAAAADDDDRG